MFSCAHQQVLLMWRVGPIWTPSSPTNQGEEENHGTLAVLFHAIFIFSFNKRMSPSVKKTIEGMVGRIMPMHCMICVQQIRIKAPKSHDVNQNKIKWNETKRICENCVIFSIFPIYCILFSISTFCICRVKGLRGFEFSLQKRVNTQLCSFKPKLDLWTKRGKTIFWLWFGQTYVDLWSSLCWPNMFWLWFGQNICWLWTWNRG